MIGSALSDFATWVLSLVGKVFSGLWDFCTDVLINGLDLLLTGFAVMISTIPAPAFLQSVNLQTSFNGISADFLFFFGVFNIGPGIALLGSAFGFRMLRKVVTLFQW
ncbi:hypothetical protein AB4Z34_36515, partial [Ensifer sp. 2YAB10]|uniref:hypothetical protein n=1 Tax=Ensifer sp. 2YAB10 TaxID=3233021 RepID=UPI003F8FE047